MPTRAMEPGATLAEILSALSHALDLTEGQPRGHATRTALIARRVAQDLGLGQEDETRAFYAALLKDSGCSTNAARIQKAFGGDELESKHDVKFVDWSRFVHAAIFALSHADRGNTPGNRLRKALELARTPPRVMDEVTLARCTRGADIARQLGFDAATAEAVRCLDEHWDGNGSPAKMRGEKIPILARILCAAQTFELFATEYSLPEAYSMLSKRNRRWFDPEIVRVLDSLATDREFWAEQAEYRGDEPPPLEAWDEAGAATDADIDDVCVAFASIVDAKSSFTAEHSSRVTDYAVALGSHLGIEGERLQTLHRAALLHDIGKLGVSNAILDKPGRLTPEEWERIKLHPRYTLEILSRIRGFHKVAMIASTHHERLDGSGYHLGVPAEMLSLEMRVLAVADVFDAITAERPYRAAMPLENAMAILRKDAGHSLDADCVEGISALVERDRLPALVRR